jgi:bifunctional ADP-heptose synthase (sugar kinase/adenylyltransferase)
MALVSNTKKRQHAAHHRGCPVHPNKKKENVDTVDWKPEEEEDRPVWVYVDAMFDLFHLGHTCVLEQAKKL